VIGEPEERFEPGGAEPAVSLDNGVEVARRHCCGTPEPVGTIGCHVAEFAVVVDRSLVGIDLRGKERASVPVVGGDEECVITALVSPVDS